MRPLVSAAFFVGFTFLAANASAQRFSEMPNNAGTYIADFGSVSGWKVVGIGTRDSSACSAFKGALDSRREPTASNYLAGNVMLFNVDTAFIFQRDVPYSRIQVENPIRLHVTGRYNMTDDDYEWRWQGDKFFTPLKRGGQFNIDKMRLTLEELKPHEGKILDVKSSSWEYPAARVGYSDDSGKLSVTGLEQVKAKIETCEKALIQEFPSHYENAVFEAVVKEPVVLPQIPQGWEKTDFGNYMAFKHEWLTFVYRKTRRGSDDTYFVIDMSQFGEVKRSKRLELKIGKRKSSLGTSRHATNRFGENLYPFTSLFLTSDDYEALNNGSLRIRAKYKGEKLDFEITGFKQAEDYRVKWNKLDPSR